MNKDIVDEIHIYLEQLQKENSQHNNEIALHKKQEDIQKLYYKKLSELQKKTENRNNTLKNQIDRSQHRIVNHKKIRLREKERKNLLDIRIKQAKEFDNQQERLRKRLTELNRTNTIEDNRSNK